jgi:hypothetical protein
MADKEFTYSDVSEHNTKKDLYVVVHDKVYNASSFVDEHPYVILFSCARLQFPTVSRGTAYDHYTFLGNTAAIASGIDC